jgi:hypothetical protein
MLRVLALAFALGASVVVGTAGAVLATGQPNQSCEEQTTRPGHAQDAPGSAFNPDGMAGTKYAGEQPQNSKNPTSVSQYDVACTNVSANHP